MATVYTTHSRSTKQSTDGSVEFLKNISTSGTKSIKMKQHLAVKHALPKTSLTHIILHDNVSRQRQLAMTLAKINYRRERSLEYMDINRRAFIQQQNKKHSTWKKDDSVRLSNMNLATVISQDRKRTGSATCVYRVPDYDVNINKQKVDPHALLPKVQVRRERTEITNHRDKTFITKFPEMVVVDERKLERYNTFCGMDMQKKHAPSKDERFKKIISVLHPLNTKANDDSSQATSKLVSQKATFFLTLPIVARKFKNKCKAGKETWVKKSCRVDEDNITDRKHVQRSLTFEDTHSKKSKTKKRNRNTDNVRQEKFQLVRNELLKEIEVDKDGDDRHLDTA